MSFFKWIICLFRGRHKWISTYYGKGYFGKEPISYQWIYTKCAYCGKLGKEIKNNIVFGFNGN